MKLVLWLSLGVAALGVTIAVIGAAAMSDAPYCADAPMPAGSVCRDTDGSGSVVRERPYEQVRRTASNLRLIVISTGVGVVLVGSIGAIFALAQGPRDATRVVPPQRRS